MNVEGIQGPNGQRIDRPNWVDRQAEETRERMQKRYITGENHDRIPLPRVELYEKFVDRRALDVVNMGLIGKARDPSWGIISKTPELTDFAPPPRSAPLDPSYSFPKK